MWYNKDAFAKAGITNVPKTWDEVETAAENWWQPVMTAVFPLAFGSPG